ncbi:hypothetical protein [Acinetobacter sp.]|uniref:hypothetical protein n=1 Tax=Acinetobacter sp. TaxID=472 RepID=UPI0038903A40
MRIHELVHPENDVVIHNEKSGHTMVLTPPGAVFNTEDTSDLRNMSVAFGILLLSDQWRIATQEEIEELRAHPPIPMMKLEWTIPAPWPRPQLTVVKNHEPAVVAYEKNGLKIYDDDDTQ